jgi:hypothetical protein
MRTTCRLPFLVLCLAAIFSTACTIDTRPQKADWESQVQKILSREQGQFQRCGKYLNAKSEKSLEVLLTFRLNPTGALETLWLDESSSWDSRFYDCLFNVVDSMNFPAFQEESTLEVQQALIFRARGTP